MRERRYEIDKDRYPSPRWSPSRHRNYSPRRCLQGDRYPREDEKSHVIERKYGFDRDLCGREGRFTDIVERDRRPLGVDDRDRRFPDSVDRDRRYSDGGGRDRRSPGVVDRSRGLTDMVDRDRRFPDAVDRDMRYSGVVNRDRRFPGVVDRNRGYPATVDKDGCRIGTKRTRSPGMPEKRDGFADYLYVRNPKFSNHGIGDREKYGESVESPKKFHDEGLLRRDRIGIGVRSSRRSYDDGLLDRDSTSTRFQWDDISEGTRKSDGLDEKYSIYKNEVYGAGDDNITRGGREREFCRKSQYVDVSRTCLAPVSRDLAGTKSFFSEYEKEGRLHSRSYTPEHDDIGGVTQSYLNVGDDSGHMPPMTSRYLNNDKEKQDYIHFKNERHLKMEGAEFLDQEKHYFEKKDADFNCNTGVYMNKLVTERPVLRDIYEHKIDDCFTSSSAFLEDDSEYIESSSRSKDYYSTSSRMLKGGFPSYSTAENFLLPAPRILPGNGLVSNSSKLDGYIEKPRRLSPVTSGGRFDDVKIHTRLYNGLPEEAHGDTLYSKFGEKYGDHAMPRFALFNSLADSSHLKQIGGDRILNQHPYSLERSTSNNFDACGSLHPGSQDLGKMHSGSLHLNYEREVCIGRGNVRSEEHDNEAYGNPLTFIEKSDMLPTKDDRSWPEVHVSERKGLDFSNFCSVEPYERRPRDRYAVDNMLYEHSIGIRISNDGSGARKIYSHSDAGVDVGHTSFSMKPNSNYELEKSGRKSRELLSSKRSSSRLITSRLSGSKYSGSSSIKKRLGPIPRKLHVSQRIVKKYQPGVKQRLAGSKNYSAFPWLKLKSSNRIPSIQIDVKENFHDPDADRPGEDLRAAGPEPPELSEEFKQMVQSAFLKFLKQINETTGKRREYMEHGKDGSLKCIVCGSNSRRFVDIEDLAMHAFMCQAVGLRSQHLGLHKALCVLMGWEIAENHRAVWQCELMSNVEASALKEDLIIWPPVIIVHNYSINGKKSDGRIIVSTESLHAKLTGMGFGSISKVINGKPPNQSIMTVKFNGTLSGLQEAERLHQLYAEKNHGRVHLKQLLSSESTSSSEGTEAGEDDENFLYGYLGIAEDLSKLDLETKKRCVVRSKNEILSIANAC